MPKFAFIPSLLLPLSCASYPEGLRLTPDGDGPMVSVDWEHKPLPDLPFPNDLATRVDAGSPTGLRVNISEVGVTQYETEARQKFNELSGFGIYAPITVGFNAPLDLDIIAAAHRDDPKLGFDQFGDDLFFVIDVNPDSPDYLQPVELDVGHGRFPMDVPDADRYFPNDPRSESPTLVFETYDEDINGNGVLDWGEDTDNDGVLDKPNVYPEGGDPRDDLLGWYERETNTLLLRPVVPLREQNTYAVVLTERLVGESGAAIRSPWKWVHHTRQTEALGPIDSGLCSLGLGMDDVAFAWTFTTGNVTGELLDVRRGLDGEGPFAALATEYPAGVTEAHQLHELAEESNPLTLPVDGLINQFVELGLFDEESGDILGDNYTEFSDALVGGTFVTPNFLADRDDNGSDTSDEWWQLDPVAGTYNAAPERVPFTCVLPKATEVSQAPFPIAIFGHGYGSSRFDFLGFAWAFNRIGYAACAMDFPGHGPTLSEQDEALVTIFLENLGMLSFLEHLQDARYRDLNNDGIPDSGGDQWTADMFHTRDMVRQAAVDWAQMVRSLKTCGEDTMALPDGSTQVSCDWNNDGIPDIGGEDNDYALLGGSLGGINAAVTAAIMPELIATVPIVPGGGLLDTAIRTEIGGAVEAMHGRLMSPLFLGYPNESGGIDLVQLVNSVTDMEELPIGTIDSIPAGGKVVVENLANGEESVGWIPEDGSFRVGIAADALDPAEKRALVGMPDDGPEFGVNYTVSDNSLLGDPLRITLWDADGNEVAVLDSWETNVEHEGVTMEAGTSLVAGSFGLGKIRGSPDLRRTATVFGAILESGDPIAYAPHYMLDPYEELGGQISNVLVMPTVGDMIVPVNTGIAVARAAGYIERETVDERYGMTEDQFLIETRVVHGLEEFGPYTCSDGNPCLFDPDDADEGTDGIDAPSGEPLRITVKTDAGASGLRIPYADQTGSHGFRFPDPNLAFDINTYAIMQVASYFLSDAQEIPDEMCLADASCEWIPQFSSDQTSAPADTGGSDTGPEQADTGARRGR